MFSCININRPYSGFLFAAGPMSNEQTMHDLSNYMLDLPIKVTYQSTLASR